MSLGNMKNPYTFEPIGIMHSPFKEKFGTPRQPNLFKGIEARIELFQKNASDLLYGLEEFSHIWVIFVFHDQQKVSKAKIRPPRLEGRKIGILASRTPHRPNPIGLSLVRITQIKGNFIEVEGGDLIDKHQF